MVSGLIGNEVPRKGLRVRISCPPPPYPGQNRGFFLRGGSISRSEILAARESANASGPALARHFHGKRRAQLSLSFVFNQQLRSTVGRRDGPRPTAHERDRSFESPADGTTRRRLLGNSTLAGAPVACSHPMRNRPSGLSGTGGTLQLVQRTLDSCGAGCADVRVDHRGAQVGVPQQLLDRADILAILQQVCGKAVPQRMAGGLFENPRAFDRRGDGLLDGRFVDMVSPYLAAFRRFVGAFAGILRSGFPRSRVGAQGGRGVQVLPAQGAAGVRVLCRQGVGQPDPAGARLHIFGVLASYELQLLAQTVFQARGQWNRAVFGSLAISDDQLPAIEIQILDAQPAGIHDAQAGTVHQAGDLAHDTWRDGSQKLPDFFAAQDDGQSFGLLSADRVELDFLLEDFAIEEQECGECLILSAGRHFSLDGQVGQEFVNFIASQFAWMPPLAEFVSLEAEELFDPLHVGFFGADGHMQGADEIPDFLQQRQLGRCDRVGRRRIWRVRIHENIPPSA
jgi:hypothetical protein